MEYLFDNVWSDRNAILLAAVELLSESDYKLSRSWLAKKAGVSTIALQKHFRCLADLQAELTGVGASNSKVALQGSDTSINHGFVR